MKIQQTWDRIQSQFQSLYTAEEAVGGVHANNRLSDKSLLDCVVFCRVTGVACARYVLSDSTKAASLAAIACGGSVEGSKRDQAILVGGDWVDTSFNNTWSLPCRKIRLARSFVKGYMDWLSQ